MDRSYKAPEQVHVYSNFEAPQNNEQPITVVSLVAYSLHGLDNYQYLGRMYEGYVDAWSGNEVRIFLDKPLN